MVANLLAIGILQAIHARGRRAAPAGAADGPDGSTSVAVAARRAGSCARSPPTSRVRCSVTRRARRRARDGARRAAALRRAVAGAAGASTDAAALVRVARRAPSTARRRARRCARPTRARVPVVAVADRRRRDRATSRTCSRPTSSRARPARASRVERDRRRARGAALGSAGAAARGARCPCCARPSAAALIREASRARTRSSAPRSSSRRRPAGADAQPGCGSCSGSPRRTAVEIDQERAARGARVVARRRLGFRARSRGSALGARRRPPAGPVKGARRLRAARARSARPRSALLRRGAPSDASGRRSVRSGS